MEQNARDPDPNDAARAPASPADGELVGKVLAGDRRAFDELIREMKSSQNELNRLGLREFQSQMKRAQDELDNLNGCKQKSCC